MFHISLFPSLCSMVEPRGSEKVRRPKFLICPPPDGTFSLFFPSLSLFLYLLYLVFAILLCCLTVQYFAVHPLSDRLSGYTLHAFLQQHRISQPLAAFPPFRSLPYSLGFPLTRFLSIIAHQLFQTSHD